MKINVKIKFGDDEPKIVVNVIKGDGSGKGMDFEMDFNRWECMESLEIRARELAQKKFKEFYG